MLTPMQRLQPRSADIASKVMDGEAIIINLANGVYYSLDRAGGLVWEQIVASRSIDESVAAVVARYEVERDRAHADVLRLVGELVAEDLVVPYDGPAHAPAAPPTGGEARAAYEPPALNVYRDMGDLLALDPPTPGLDSPWQDATQTNP